MSSVLDFFLEGPWDDGILTTPSGATPPNLPMRSAMLMTPSDVKELVSCLKKKKPPLSPAHSLYYPFIG